MIDTNKLAIAIDSNTSHVVIMTSSKVINANNDTKGVQELQGLTCPLSNVETVSNKTSSTPTNISSFCQKMMMSQ